MAHTRIKVRVSPDVLPAVSELYATACKLHESAHTTYRNALHRHGHGHPTTADALGTATIAGLYLADMRTRYYRIRAAAAAEGQA